MGPWVWGSDSGFRKQPLILLVAFFAVGKSIATDDLIEMDGGIYGFIRQINARYTVIETFDGKEIMVPNEDFYDPQGNQLDIFKCKRPH